MSAFGVEHIAKAMNPTKFARLYPPGEHHIPVRHLTAIRRSEPRRAANVSAVATSMHAEGQHHPIRVNLVRGRAYIMNGHHRLEAARQLGRKKVRVRVQEGPLRMWEDPAHNSGWARPAPHLPRGRFSKTPLDTV